MRKFPDQQQGDMENINSQGNRTLHCTLFNLRDICYFLGTKNVKTPED